jgi:hypothetical protein
MQPARGGGITDRVAHGHGESNDIVLYAGFDLMDLRDIDFGAGSDCGCRILRDLARFGESLGGCQFDFQPLCKLIRIAPNVTHLLACVA